MNDEFICTIDAGACKGCGTCVRVCPMRRIVLQTDAEGYAKACQVEGIGDCLGCGHCLAACPEQAVRVDCLDPETMRFVHFTADTRWLPHGGSDVAQLVRLLASRRSCRNYADRPVPLSLLEDLVKIGITAPSGTNSQRWAFTLLSSREAVLSLAQSVSAFFMKLNRMADKSWLRLLLKYTGKPELEEYHREYYRAVSAALEAWKKRGEDRLFHGAPAAIIVSSAPGASCPAEDAMLATQNILLGAHTLGLGSCLIGYVVAAMENDAKIQQKAGIPKEEKVYAVIALGYPHERFSRVAERKMPVIRKK